MNDQSITRKPIGDMRDNPRGYVRPFSEKQRELYRKMVPPPGPPITDTVEKREDLSQKSK